MEKLTLQDAFKEARSIAKNTSPKATFILDRVVSKDKREYLNLCYAYLRWVDDVVDAPETSLSKKSEFINRQKKMINSYQNKSEYEPETKEEYFLYYFCEFALQNNLEKLVESVYEMVDTIGWDIDRLHTDGIFSEEQLYNYNSIQSEVMQNLLYYFMTGNDPKEYTHDNLELSIANTKMLMLRDLKEDIEMGYINISREDIEKFNLDVRNLKQDEKLNLWIKDQVQKLLNTLYNEVIKLKNINAKGRIFHYYTCSYYLPKIIRYKVYGYYLGSSEKRTFLKEVTTYWQSSIISLKLLKRIYL